MKILKIAVEVRTDHQGDTWFHVAVKVESAPGFYKVYWSHLDNYPTITDAERIARTGRKVTDRDNAERLTGITLLMEFEA
ncbi:MAG: hypothetical protein DA408_14490 [Bacteroidetes bacterium]|nr:MAG: hypothetical protein DA408_14490 [Bacteroidota bacterium]